MTETISSSTKLFHSTAECDDGPEILFRPGKLILRYDYESEAGQEWVSLIFSGAIAVRFTPDIAVTLLMISTYGKVCEIGNSVWLSELQSHQKLADSLRHYMVYFDHNGCVEVISDGFTVEST